MRQDGPFCLYGTPPAELAETPAHAVQASPLMPDSAALEDFAPESLSGMVMAAPPSTIERRYSLALALRSLKPGAPLTALAPKEKGGSRLGAELKAFGCQLEETGRRHQRICHAARPEALVGVNATIEAGGLQRLDALGLWTQPGVFSWDRIDPGSALLGATLPALSGLGADLGCGIGVLAEAVLRSSKVTGLEMVDIDRRAIAAANRNVTDPRAAFHWADACSLAGLEGLDFVVMNPPFHDAGAEDKALGQAFIRAGHRMLRKGGALWLVANRHLPYEAVLTAAFSRVALKAERGGFKVYEAIR